MASYFGHVWLIRLLFQRGLAALDLLAFLGALLQFKPLLGERGLLPVPAFVAQLRLRDSPSIFVWRYSDRLLTIVAWTGIALSAIALTGLYEGPALWLVLWVLYVSIVNVGQTFYAFGWESMLCEAGFFAIFLGTPASEPSLIPILALRWMLFRTELGAGLIKLRHDQCWRDLTCLYYHYETQPLPNATSWYFHRLPKILHRFAVLFSHFVQVIVPFGLFAPQPYASIAGALIVFHQLWLIVSGNYAWLNWLTVILGITAFYDWRFVAPPAEPRPMIANYVLYALGVATLILSIRPALNLFSRHQLMNYSYNPLHIVNTYGAFGSVTKDRYEIVIEGSSDGAEWREYGFKAKPDDVRRRPPQVAPYHLRLDWLLWFLPFSVAVTPRGIATRGYDVWFIRFIRRLLENDAPTLRLLRTNPFAAEAPRYVRALFYRYRYTTPAERRESGAWWHRELIDMYLPAVSREVLEATEI